MVVQDAFFSLNMYKSRPRDLCAAGSDAVRHPPVLIWLDLRNAGVRILPSRGRLKDRDFDKRRFDFPAE